MGGRYMARMSSLPTTIEEAIEAVALGPRKASGDSGSVEHHSLSDLVAASRLLRADDAIDSNPLQGMRFAKFVPPGAV